MNKRETDFNETKQIITNALMVANEGFKTLVHYDLTTRMCETLDLYRECMNLTRKVIELECGEDNEYMFSSAEAFPAFDEILNKVHEKKEQKAKEERCEYYEALKKYNPERLAQVQHIDALKENAIMLGEKYRKGGNEDDYAKYREALNEVRIAIAKLD